MASIPRLVLASTLFFRFFFFFSSIILKARSEFQILTVQREGKNLHIIILWKG